MVIISPQTRPKNPPTPTPPPRPLVYRRVPVYGLMVIRPARIRGSLRANCWREPEPEASETDGNQMSPPGLFPPAWVDPISHEPCGGDDTAFLPLVCVYIEEVFMRTCVFCVGGVVLLCYVLTRGPAATGCTWRGRSAPPAADARVSDARKRARTHANL